MGYNKSMKVVATQANQRFLISLEDDMVKVNADSRARGQVLDMCAGHLYPPVNIHSLYSAGYWEPCEVSPEELNAMLDKIKRDGPAFVKKTGSVY